MVGALLMVAKTGVRAEEQVPLLMPTKYVVLIEIEGVTNVFPVPMLVPPVETVYQSGTPADAVADKVTGPDPHF